MKRRFGQNEIEMFLRRFKCRNWRISAARGILQRGFVKSYAPGRGIRPVRRFDTSAIIRSSDIGQPALGNPGLNPSRAAALTFGIHVWYAPNLHIGPSTGPRPLRNVKDQ